MNPMKMLLLAGAGYLAYTYFVHPQAAAGTTTTAGTAPPPPSTGTGAQNPAAQTVGASTGPTGGNACSSTPAPDNMTLMRAATNPAWVGPAGNYCQNAWQWNYWRQQYQIQVVGNATPDPATTQPAFDDITNPSTNITAAEYQALLSRKGLSGLRYAPILPYGGWSALTH